MAKIFVVSAPSGGGKTSLVNGVMGKLPDLHLSISYTTRPKRPGEEDGKNYHFVAQGEFDRMVEQGKFLEHAEVFGNCYGTARQVVEESLAAGQDVILEIDWQGAKQIKENFPAAVLIFLLPPSLATLSERLHKRASDSKETIQRRLEEAEQEIAQYGLFDHLLVNEDFDHTLQKLIELILSFRAGEELVATRRETQEQKLGLLLQDLLGS